jgi:hypothetical protein
MSIFSFDGYSQFCDWCEENGYDPDEQYDLESEPHKRNTYDSFYIKKLDSERYAQVSVETSYDNGWGYGDIEQEGLTRTEEVIQTVKVVYK